MLGLQIALSATGFSGLSPKGLLILTSRTILVVDDAADVRAALRRLLTEAGFTVELATDGRNALEVLKRWPLPEAIVLDLIMPVMDGCEFLEHKARDAVIRAIPVFVLTSHDHSHVNLKHVVGLFQKPQGVFALISALQHHLTSAAPNQEIEPPSR
jgi:CheY-like chemotaxis protein